MNNKGYGIRVERDYKNMRLLNPNVLLISRAAASAGLFDLIILSKAEKGSLGTLELVSVKSSRSKVAVGKKETEKLKKIVVPKKVIVIKKLVTCERGKFKEEEVN